MKGFKIQTSDIRSPPKRAPLTPISTAYIINTQAQGSHKSKAGDDKHMWDVGKMSKFQAAHACFLSSYRPQLNGCMSQMCLRQEKTE